MNKNTLFILGGLGILAYLIYQNRQTAPLQAQLATNALNANSAAGQAALIAKSAGTVGQDLSQIAQAWADV